jgi:hypothetical protein
LEVDKGRFGNATTIRANIIAYVEIVLNGRS